MGGGGSKTTNTTNIKTQAIVDAMARAIMKCKGNQTINQKFVLSGSYNVIKNFKMVQAFNLSATCSNNAQNTQDIQSAVSSAIKQQLSSQSESVTGAIGNGSSSDVNLIVDNEVRTTLTSETITEVITNTMAQQEAIISGNNNIVDEFEMSQTLSILQENCQEVVSGMKSVQAITNTADTTQTTTQTNPISSIIDSVFGGLTGMFYVYAIIIIAALGIGAYVFVNGGPIGMFFGSSSDTNYAQPGYQSMQQSYQPMNYAQSSYQPQSYPSIQSNYQQPQSYTQPIQATQSAFQQPTLYPPNYAQQMMQQVY